MNDFDNLLILNSLYTTASLVTKLDNYILHPSSCKHFVFWAQLTDDYIVKETRLCRKGEKTTKNNRAPAKTETR